MKLANSHYLEIAAAILLCGAQFFSAGWLAQHPKPLRSEEAQVYLPPALQLVSSGGDRYLAANINTYRAMVMGIDELRPETYQILAWMQRDAARFNPGHEDNYYIAAATLPWHGYLPEAQEILASAEKARPQDKLPPFLFGFHQMHLEGNVSGAVATLRQAGARMKDENDRLQFQELASRWLVKGDLNEAARIVRIMALQTSNLEFRAHLRKRALRFELLAKLRRIADQRANNGFAALNDLSQLVSEGLLDAVPDDPMGGAFVVNKSGRIVAIDRKPRNLKP